MVDRTKRRFAPADCVAPPLARMLPGMSDPFSRKQLFLTAGSVAGSMHVGIVLDPWIDASARSVALSLNEQ